jgi:hypothetical protein
MLWFRNQKQTWRSHSFTQIPLRRYCQNHRNAAFQFPDFNNFNRRAAQNADPKDSDSYKEGTGFAFGEPWMPVVTLYLNPGISLLCYQSLSGI